jgi:hypothetical protein
MQKIFLFTVAMLASSSIGSTLVFARVPPYTEWECGNGITVKIGRNGIYLSPNKPIVTTKALEGEGEVEVSFTLKWDFNPDPPKIWLNGKECRPHDFFNIDPHMNLLKVPPRPE